MGAIMDNMAVAGIDSSSHKEGGLMVIIIIKPHIPDIKIA